LIESEITAHCREGLGVFAQALGFKALARKTTAGKVPLARINLSEPPFVLPGTTANVNAIDRKRLQACCQRLAIERAALFEERPYHARAAR